MDMYGISEASAQGNNYQATLAENQHATLAHNELMKDQIEKTKLDLSGALGQSSGAEALGAAKGMIMEATTGFGMYKNYQRKKGEAMELEQKAKAAKSNVQNALTNSDEVLSVGDRDAQAVVKGGNLPSLQLSGGEGQGVVGAGDNVGTLRPTIEAPASGGSAPAPDPPQAENRPSLQQLQEQQASREQAQSQGEKPPSAEPAELSTGGEKAGGAVVQTSEDARAGKTFLARAGTAVEGGLETAGKYAGIAGALTGGGLAIAADVTGKWGAMNTAEKVGNVGTITGAGAETAGLIAMALPIPGARLVGAGLELFGELSSLFGGGVQAVGDVAAAEAAKKNASATAAKAITQAKAQEAGAAVGSVTESAAGGSSGAIGSSQKEIQGTGSF